MRTGAILAGAGAGFGIAFTVYTAIWWKPPKSLWSLVFWALTTGLLMVVARFNDASFQAR